MVKGIQSFYREQLEKNLEKDLISSNEGKELDSLSQIFSINTLKI